MEFEGILRKARDDEIICEETLYLDVETGIAEKYRGELP